MGTSPLIDWDNGTKWLNATIFESDLLTFGFMICKIFSSTYTGISLLVIGLLIHSLQIHNCGACQLWADAASANGRADQ